MSAELIIGLMSGTSVDGIDAALVEFESDRKLTVLATQFTAFDQSLQQRINQFAQCDQVPKPPDYAELDFELAQLYTAASLNLLAKSGTSPVLVSALANHGQTIAHHPTARTPFSLQIGNPQTIANLTRLTTIGQFRQADIAVGGQGAPLMPAFHQALFRNRQTGLASESERKTLVLNLGGIANISRLGESVVGFDTGPANTLLNQWIRHCRQQAFDTGGEWAASGSVIPEVLSKLMGDPYFSLPYPKSTGPDYFNLAWLEQNVAKLAQYPAEDIQATLLELSVTSIALDVDALAIANERSQQTDPDSNHRGGDLYLCGGGVHNAELIRRLEQRLGYLRIRRTDELGVPADWVEATGFAWLGYCQLHGIPSNLPSVTGASRPVVLGQRFEPE